MSQPVPTDRFAWSVRSRLQLLRETGPVWADDGPDDSPDDDRLDDLADEITTLAAHIHAATARLLELISAFDRARGWAREGHRSCAHWLAYRTGIALGAARERVRAARALEGLPETSASMARGELSFSKVRALTRVATRETESDLLELARGCTTAQMERVVRAWKKHGGADEREVERDLHASRTLSVFPDDEGMYLVRGRVPAEVGALLMRAIEAASDAIYRGADAVGGEDDDGDTAAAAARRRADALALLAERAMAAGFGSGRAGDAADADAGGDDAPISGTRAERYQVMLHVSAETLSAAEAGAGEAYAALEDGTRVSAETSRRLSCDASVVRVTHGGDEPLSIGRRTRTIPPALRRALELRDGGCRFPGCGLRFTDAHHIRHWADGGETSLANCILLCRHHHRLVHEEGWRIVPARPDAPGASRVPGADAPTFVDPRGGLHHEGRWRPPTLDPDVLRDAARELAARNRRRGADPGPLTPSARWRREGDIPDDLRFAALEATA